MRTFKKQLNFIFVSSASLTADTLIQGVDSTALGQTTITDAAVPTGSKIKGILIMLGLSAPSTTSVEVGVNLQYLLAGQATNVDPLAVGGNAQRNQVIKSWHFLVAQDSMVNFTQFVKIPRMFQRIRENMLWRLVISSSSSREQGHQSIYKVRL